MPRRAVLTPAQREALLALPPDDDAALARHYTLGDEVSGDMRIWTGNDRRNWTP